MQNQLDEIEQLLKSTDEVDVDEIEDELQQLRDKINKTEYEKLNKLDDELDDNKQQVLLNEVKLNELNSSLSELKQQIKELENNGTKLQEANVQGALALIGNAKEKADKAIQKAESSQVRFTVNCFYLFIFHVFFFRKTCNTLKSNVQLQQIFSTTPKKCTKNNRKITKMNCLIFLKN